jgi:hypothetical protein
LAALGAMVFVPSTADGWLQIEPVIMINYPTIHYQVSVPSVNPILGPEVSQRRQY